MEILAHTGKKIEVLNLLALKSYPKLPASKRTLCDSGLVPSWNP